MSGRIYELTLYETPKSLNTVGSRGSHWAYTKEKKKWEGLLGMALMVAKVPRHLARVEASAVLTFKQKRTRDEGNYRMMLEKALGDVLVAGGWLSDDDPERYSFGKLVFDPDRGDPLTKVAICVENDCNEEAVERSEAA